MLAYFKLAYLYLSAPKDMHVCSNCEYMSAADFRFRTFGKKEMFIVAVKL